MRRSAWKIAAVLLASGACATAATSARADIAFGPCGDTNNFACGHLTVPLDPTGATPGAITLAIRRHRAPAGEARTAIVALAGGPGQAAIPFAEQFAEMLGPIASTHDLLIFDQRGIGLSNPLSCHRFERFTESGPAAQAIRECAAQIGPARTFYTTDQTVADIEAMRVAGGYEKLVLYGTSYGTKVAERYAQAHPTRVEALVLDSVVPPNGPDPLDRATLAAVPRVLRDLCARRACARITPDPVADLARLVRRMHGSVLHGRWIDANGRAHTIGASSAILLGTLLAGDFAPSLRAEFPAAVRDAAEGDNALLARMLVRAFRGEGDEREGPAESFDGPLYFATICEEDLFPWSRASSPTTRLAEAHAQIDALDTSTIAPFTRSDLVGLSDLQACSAWPFSTPAPVSDTAPLPGVPTLIFSGAADLRTPTANAREVAAKIPGAHLVVVAHVGHSVLSADTSGCARRALLALFAAKPIRPCSTSPRSSLQLPSPLAPRRLTEVRPAAGSRGRPGRTLDAVVLTLQDAIRQLRLQIAAQLSSSGRSGGALSVGGLRSGRAVLAEGTLAFHEYSYVPGVTLSGEFAPGRTKLRIAGAAAAHGALRVVAHKRLEGTLEGHRVSLPAGLSSLTG
ncbi:MAG TPA: alpha/beta fold hydrolase [Solirubrobacteraceae bacterium]|jgi:pimeloyl-ACP methyl ester carboxylesterase